MPINLNELDLDKVGMFVKQYQDYLNQNPELLQRAEEAQTSNNSPTVDVPFPNSQTSGMTQNIDTTDGKFSGNSVEVSGLGYDGGAKLPSSSFENAIKQPQPQSIIEQIQNAPLMDKDALPFAEGINKAQNAWAAANAAGDQKAMDAAHQQAEAWRQVAEINNIDLGLLGSGDNLSPEQSNLFLANDNYRRAKDFEEKFDSVKADLRDNYAQSSQQYFGERYDYYRQRGLSDWQATIKAGQDTRGYYANRMGALRNAIDEYGINGGVMNDFGVSVLGQIAAEDNIMGSAYAQAYDTPAKMNEYMREIQKMALTQNYAQQNMRLGSTLADKNALKAWIRSQTSKDRDVKREIDTYKGKIQISEEMQKRMAEFNATNANKTVWEQIDGRRKLAAELNLPEDIAKIYIATGTIPNPKNWSGDKIGVDKTMTNLEKQANVLNTRMKNIATQLNDPMLDDATRAQLQQEYAWAQNDFVRLTKTMSYYNGLEVFTDEGLIERVLKGREITKDWNNDLPIVRDLNDWAYTMAEIDPNFAAFKDPRKRQEFISDILVECGGYSKEDADKAVGIETNSEQTPKSESKSAEKKAEQPKTPPKVTSVNLNNGQVIANAANPQQLEG